MPRAKVADRKPRPAKSGLAPKISFTAEEIVLRKVDDLIPFPNNPKIHTPAQIDAIAANITAFGFDQPILIDETDTILKGHGRQLAARKAGFETVPTIVRKGLSVAQKWAIVISDNALPAMTGFDNSLLRIGLTTLAKLDFDLKLTGFDDVRLATFGVGGTAPRSDPDEEQVLHAETISKLGDLWLLGAHRLIAGDCCDAETVKFVMDGKTSKLCNTDPPYGVDYSKIKNGIPGSGFKNHTATWGDIENDGLTEGAALQEFLERAIKVAASQACAPNAAWYLWHPMLTQGTFFAAAAAADILIHRQIIWVKPGFVLTRSGQYHWKHELCFYGWIKGNPAPWYGDKSQTSVWEVGRDNDSGQHPTQKPVELFIRPINNHTRQGESVYEPFCGSGSQIIAAEMTGRVCHAVEIEPRYVDVAVRRWQTFTGKKAVLQGTKKTFDQIEKERSKAAA